MQLIEDADCDLMENFSGTPAAGNRIPSLRRGHNNVSLLHLCSLLREAECWIDKHDL